MSIPAPCIDSEAPAGNTVLFHRLANPKIGLAIMSSKFHKERWPHRRYQVVNERKMSGPAT